MACLTNKDMSKEPFATLAWAQFKREKKKKNVILDGKKNEITVCQREIDRSGREGGRFLLFFCLLVSKQAFCPGQGKQKWKALISNLSSALCAHREGPLLMAPAIPSFLARQGCLGVRTVKSWSLPCVLFPGRLTLELHVLQLRLDKLYLGGLQIFTAFEITSSP